MEIRDDGHGFDPESVVPDADGQSGIGVVGMRERLRLLGGRLELESVPAGRRWSGRSCRRGRLRHDPDRRPDRHELLQPEDRLVRDPDAAVRDGLPEQRGRVRAVDPDDAAAGPLAQLRVGARLEAVRAQDRGRRANFAIT